MHCKKYIPHTFTILYSWQTCLKGIDLASLCGTSWCFSALLQLKTIKTSFESSHQWYWLLIMSWAWQHSYKEPGPLEYSHFRAKWVGIFLWDCTLVSANKSISNLPTHLYNNRKDRQGISKYIQKTEWKNLLKLQSLCWKFRNPEYS